MGCIFHGIFFGPLDVLMSTCLTTEEEIPHKRCIYWQIASSLFSDWCAVYNFLTIILEVDEKLTLCYLWQCKKIQPVVIPGFLKDVQF